MEYTGKLYGKAGNIYFPLEKTTKDIDWQPINNNRKIFDEIIKRDGDCLLKFNNGQILRYNECDWPFAEAIYFKPF
jgi:hypothetical protein